MTDDTPTPPPAASDAIEARATQIAGDALEEIVRETKGDPEYVAIILRAVIVKLNAAREASENMANG
jgi:hypothetical protein